MSSVRDLIASAFALFSPAPDAPASPAPLTPPKPITMRDIPIWREIEKTPRKSKRKRNLDQPDLDWLRRNAFPHPVPGCSWSDADLARDIRANVSMRTGQIVLKDRRKPWQRELVNFSVDRTGSVVTGRR
jgi:hypothetical protein